MGDWLQTCEGSPRYRLTDEGLYEREGVGVVRLGSPAKVAQVQQIIADYGDAIAAKSAAHGFPAEWLVGLIRFESGGNPGAESPGVGARGLVQMMPSTATQLGLDPQRLWEPEYAIEAALVYMDGNVKRYGLDLPVLAGAYNAGSKRCAPQTACKTRGVKDGTFADNEWGLIEDCQNGVSSRYITQIIAGANEARLLGYPGELAVTDLRGRLVAVLAALGFGALTSFAVFTYLQD
jgi:hypothetical protein